MEQKSKKILIGICAGALVAAVSVGGTLSYLHMATEIRANNFTFGKLRAILTEPEWDGVIDYEYDEDDDTSDPIPIYGYDEDGNPIYDPDKRPEKNPSGRPYGDEMSENMIAGQEAPKNPMITNTCKYDEWVAMKITFVYGEDSDKAGQILDYNDDFKALLDVIEINYDDYVISRADYTKLTDEEKAADTGRWVRNNGTASDLTQVFFYSKPLKGSETGTPFSELSSTTPIFDTVKVKDYPSNKAMERLIEIGGFAIWIQGYVIQAEQYASLDEWFNGPLVQFPNDKPTKDDVARPGIIRGGPVEEATTTEEP